MTHKNIRLASLLAILFGAFGTNQSVGQQTLLAESHPISRNPVTTETVESLKRKMLEATQKLESIRICSLGEYENPTLAGANAFYRVSLCVKAPHFLFYDSAHGHDSMDWQLDPYRQRAFVLKDQVYNEYPLDRMFFHQPIDPHDPFPGSLQTAFFFLATGHWPAIQREAPRYADLPYVLREVALSQETHLHLRSELEQIGGRWCHVLEHPGVDCLWIDAERSGSLVQREVSDPETGRRLQRYRLLEQEQFSDQIWIPRLIENTIFSASDPSGNSSSQKEVTSRTRIVECAVNEVADTAFDYRIPAGALEFNEHDLKEPPHQIAAGGLDQFDQMADWIQGDRVSSITVGPAHSDRSENGLLSVSTLTLSIAWVAVLIVICEAHLRLAS